MLVMRKTQLLRITLALTMLFASPESWAQFGRVEFSEAGDFSESAVTRGVKATHEQCAKVANAVWAVAGNQAECLRYWAAGFEKTTHQRAIVFFHGDVFVGVGKTNPEYLNTSLSAQQDIAEVWAKRLNAPYVSFARPGTFGSSGDHMQRRRKPESELISAALDLLKARLGVEEWVVAGQSGGGHVTASLLSQRNDIVCAVPTSSPSSPRVRWEIAGRTRDTTNYADSYEPTQYLFKDRMHPKLKVFVLGDLQDKNVFWPSQTVLADALQKINVPVSILRGEGTGSDAHGLSRSARIVASWCYKDTPSSEIEALAIKGLKG